MTRVVVVGLDCVPPRLAFDLYEDCMPNLTALRRRGTWGPMQSTVPPITVPAWAAMFSGRDPGELGVYGFQVRSAGTREARIVEPRDLQQRPIWHAIGQSGRRVAVLFVPPSYPPEPVEGVSIGCFLTPEATSRHTYPPQLQHALEARFGPYQMDVEDFRTDDLWRVRHALHDLTSQHFDVARFVLQTEQPDFLAMVDIGPDRFHHAFYRYIEPRHPRHDPDSPYRDEGRHYYNLLDRKLGQLMEVADPNTVFMVVSDHGARPLLGCVCINEWLIERGYLRLATYPDHATPFSEAAIDWTTTTAFGTGGYCGRVHVNLRGREPAGIVAPEAADALLARIGDELAALPSPAGQAMRNRVITSHHYRDTRGVAPDLQVFFGDLDYRAVASVGHRSLYLEDNDRGPDGCNHDWHGIFVIAGGGLPARGYVDDCEIYDVARTCLGLFGIAADDALLGRDRSQ